MQDLQEDNRKGKNKNTAPENSVYINTLQMSPIWSSKKLILGLKDPSLSGFLTHDKIEILINCN